MRNPFAALRHVRLVPKLLRLTRDWPVLALDLLRLRREPYALRLRNGTVVELRPRTSDWWIFLEIFVFEHYTPAYAMLRQAQVVIDIGANVGYFSILATALNRRLRLIAFEPFPGNFRQLKRNLELNPGVRVEARPTAISDRTGSSTMYFTAGDESGCSLHHDGSQSTTVPTLDVKELFTTAGIETCDVIKMDCEGAEYPILKAMPAAMLARTRAMIMEYHDNDEMVEIRAILERAGFRCSLQAAIHTLYAVRD